MPEGDEDGCPATDRRLAGERARSACFLAQQPRGDWKVDQRPGVRGGKSGASYLYLRNFEDRRNPVLRWKNSSLVHFRQCKLRWSSSTPSTRKSVLRFHSVFSDSSLSSVISANSDSSSTSKSQAPVHKNIKTTHTSKTTYNQITQKHQIR